MQADGGWKSALGNVMNLVFDLPVLALNPSCI